MIQKGQKGLEKERRGQGKEQKLSRRFKRRGRRKPYARERGGKKRQRRPVRQRKKLDLSDLFSIKGTLPEKRKKYI